MTRIYENIMIGYRVGSRCHAHT